MSYSINGKIFTSHALMDEIIYNTKILIKGLVLKNEKLADKYETELSMELADEYIACLNGSMDLSFFPLTKEILVEYGCSELQASQWASDYTLIPEELQDEVLSFCCNYMIDHYVEYNDYYRKLNGQPEYSANHPDDYNVTIGKYNYYDIDGTLHNKFDYLFDKDFTNTDFNKDTPIHKFSVNQINILESIGVMDAIRDIEINNKPEGASRTIIDPDGKPRIVDDTAKHYKYLDYLGTKQIDIYTARIAKNWDILYMPHVEYLVEDRFKELYRINRDIYERRTYQLAYSESSDYFEEIIILLIIGQTFSDIITDTPEWYIRRDVFDLRTVQYFLTSQGIKFFEDIPMRYQIRIVKGMNKLIKYKSTDKNIFDILEIFNISGIVVYKYYLIKHYIKTDNRTYIVIGEEDKEWSMEAEYDFGFEDTDNIGDTGDGHGNDVPGSEVYEFIDMDDEDYEDPDADYDYYYDFRSEDWDAWDDSSFMLPEYDFHDEDSDPNTIHNTSIDGVEDLTKDELFDFGLLAWDVIEDYDERELIYDFNSEDAEFVDPTNVTERKLNYQEKVKVIKDEFNNIYELQFVKTPVGEEYDDYIKNSIYRENYDAIVKNDKYWNGQDVHYLVRNNHLKKKFTIEGTKYLGIEYNIDMRESNYEKSYYLGTLMNARIDTSDVVVSIPQMSNKSFTLLNLLIFVYCLNGVYTNTSIPTQDATKFVTKRTEEPIDFDPYTDFDGGFVWTETDPPEPEEESEPEPFYGFDDYGDEDVEDFDPDTIEIINDFGYNFYIDWEKTEYYKNYDYGIITDTSIDDEYSEQPVDPSTIIPEFDYAFDDYVFVDWNKPYHYCNQYYVDQTTGEHILITPQFMDDHPELIGTRITIVYLWTEWSKEELGEYTIDLDNHGVYDWNDKDQYEVHMDGGDIDYSARITRQTFYDYIRTDHSELYVDCVGRITGFNNINKLEDIAEAIGFRHSEHGFERGYTLEECGVAEFITPTKINSMEDMYVIYQTNTACYKKLQEKMKFANSRDERRVLEYVYLKLFTVPWDTSFYILRNGEIAETYDQILLERDFNLYTIYTQLLKEGDSNLRIFNTRNCLNIIADTLNYYIHGNNLEYILSFISTMSYDAQLHYVSEMIDFFKSWKMHFLDPKLSYTIDDKNENSAAYGDQLADFRIQYWTPDNYKTGDNVTITPLYYPIDKPGDWQHQNVEAEIVDIASHYDNDANMLEDTDYDGGWIDDTLDDEAAGILEFIDIDGGGVHKLTEDQIQYAIDHSIFITNCSSEPYYQVEGCEISASKDLYDIDGGGVLEANEYLMADGLHILDPARFIPHDPYPFKSIDPDVEYSPLDISANMFNGGEETEDDLIFNPSSEYSNYIFAEEPNSDQTDIDIIVGRSSIIYGGSIPPQEKPYIYYDYGEENMIKLSLLGYDIDGGVPNIHYINNGSIRISIDEYNQIQSDVIRADYVTNGLEIKDDGLYFDRSPYIETQRIDDSINVGTMFKDDAMRIMQEVHDISIILNPGYLETFIRGTIGDYMFPYFVVKDIITQNYANNKVAKFNENGKELTEWFIENNPYKWIAL